MTTTPLAHPDPRERLPAAIPKLRAFAISLARDVYRGAWGALTLPYGFGTRRTGPIVVAGSLKLRTYLFVSRQGSIDLTGAI